MTRPWSEIPEAARAVVLYDMREKARMFTSRARLRSQRVGVAARIKISKDNAEAYRAAIALLEGTDEKR